MREGNSPYRVIVMGKTGSGKSSVLNAMVKSNEFGVGSSIMSETKEVKAFRGKFRGRLASPDIVFIDTPGFFDSSSKDNQVIAKIATCLRKIEDGLNLILFCFPAYEIRLDASLQASWKFLKLVMGKSVYEHVIIVLTHGNRLSANELETAITRMTREFIPYIRNSLKCKVKEEILIFLKGEEPDGLEDIMKYITLSSKYQPRIMEDLGKFWKEEDPLGSIEYLLQNSQIFKKIQDILQDCQIKNTDIQEQIEEIKKEMETMSKDQNKEIRKEIGNVGSELQGQCNKQNKDMQSFKVEIEMKMKAMQQQLIDRDRQVVNLQKGMEEMKSIMPAQLAESSQIPSTARPPTAQNLVKPQLKDKPTTARVDNQISKENKNTRQISSHEEKFNETKHFSNQPKQDIQKRPQSTQHKSGNAIQKAKGHISGELREEIESKPKCIALQKEIQQKPEYRYLMGKKR